MWQGRAKLRAKANYFIGEDRGRWRTNVPLFAAVEATNVQGGVDMVVYGGDGGFEYDLRVQPHTDLSELRLAFPGSARMQLTADGDAKIESTNGRELLMKKPRIYEEWPSANVTGKVVMGGYEMEDDGTIGFAIGPY
ncbi:MAG: hypothetical protein ACRD5Z_23715, partial [Bryobacteraceae bacterium]